MANLGHGTDSYDASRTVGIRPGPRRRPTHRVLICIANPDAARSRRAVGRGFSLTSESVAALGVDLGKVEDGDASAAEPDQSPFGVVAEHFGDGLAGGAGQRRDLLVGQYDDR